MLVDPGAGTLREERRLTGSDDAAVQKLPVP